jgi:hypothetical protein
MISEISNIELTNMVLTFIIALSATYLAYAALKHSARPNAKVILIEPDIFYTNETVLFKFSFKNAGHWYSKPMVVNMTVYINFDNRFELIFIKYGSIQHIEDTIVKIGKGKMKYMKAITLT